MACKFKEIIEGLSIKLAGRSIPPEIVELLEQGKALLADESVVADKDRPGFISSVNDKIKNVLTKLYPEIDLQYTTDDIEYADMDGSVMNQVEYGNKVNLMLKLVDSLYDIGTAKKSKYGGTSQPVRSTIRRNSPKNSNIEANLRKNLSSKGVPKEQIDLMFEYMKQNDIAEIGTIDLAERLLFGLGYGVEIKVTEDGFDFSGKPELEDEYNMWDKLLGSSTTARGRSEARINLERLENENRLSSSYYENLTVPGGTNYKEMEIKTPNVVAKVKGHADFSTDEGIGWFRVDDGADGVLRVLEMQSDIFQKNKDMDVSKGRPVYDNMRRDELDLLDSLNKERDELLRGRFRDQDREKDLDSKIERIESKYTDTDLDKALHQLLNTNNKWVKFFVQSIVQHAERSGYTSVRFPSGETVAKIEGYTKEHSSESVKNFYQSRVQNTLKKEYGKDRIRTVIDEHGNSWFELEVDSNRDSNQIMLQKQNGRIKGQADIKAKTVLISSLLETTDTLPHEYAHHYIAWFRDTPIVQEAIKKWGNEEALVQAIGEQSVRQEGDAWNWWKKFTQWVQGRFDKLDTRTKEELRDILTDAFLTRQNLATTGISSDLSSNVLSTSTKENSGFQGYMRGFSTLGKGTPEGDGKDKAMRDVSDGFIGETAYREGVARPDSSTYTSGKDISEKIDNALLKNNTTISSLQYSSSVDDRLKGTPFKIVDTYIESKNFFKRYALKSVHPLKNNLTEKQNLKRKVIKAILPLINTATVNSTFVDDKYKYIIKLIGHVPSDIKSVVDDYTYLDKKVQTIITNGTTLRGLTSFQKEIDVYSSKLDGLIANYLTPDMYTTSDTMLITFDVGKINDLSISDERISSNVIMLAKNSKNSFKAYGNSNKEMGELSKHTKSLVLSAHEGGATFVVGDMPGVDTQFITYLDEIGASYRVYTTNREGKEFNRKGNEGKKYRELLEKSSKIGNSEPSTKEEAQLSSGIIDLVKNEINKNCRG